MKRPKTPKQPPLPGTEKLSLGPRPARRYLEAVRLEREAVSDFGQYPFGSNPMEVMRENIFDVVNEHDEVVGCALRPKTPDGQFGFRAGLLGGSIGDTVRA